MASKPKKETVVEKDKEDDLVCPWCDSSKYVRLLPSGNQMARQKMMRCTLCQVDWFPAIIAKD